MSRNLRNSSPPLYASLTFASLLVAAAAPSAHAHKRDFVWTYEWFTPIPGEKEIETWLTFDEETDKLTGLLEYEFAPSDGWALGLYAISERTPEDGLRLRGAKVETRYAFGTYARRKWLHGAYLELKKEHEEPYELEAKWILTRYSPTTHAITALNLIAEKKLDAGEDVEWGYAWGWSRSAGRQWQVGAEGTGKFEGREHYLGPTAAFDVNPACRIILGGAVGLTDESQDLRLRAIAEWEWF